MNRSDGMCRICMNNEETLTHLFHDCHHISLMWNCIIYNIELIVSTQIDLKIRDIIFGMKIGNSDLDYCNTLFINYIILNCKWIIWKHRNKTKFENVPGLNYFKLSDLVIKECKRNVALLLKSRHRCKMKDRSIQLFEDLLNLNFV